MRSSNIKYIPELDQLRGLAVLLVFYFHAIAAMSVAPYYFGVGANSTPIVRSPLDVLIVNGFTGVALFFALSGFILTSAALNADKVNWKNFYINRFLRLFPLYLVVNLLAFSVGKMPSRQLMLNLIGFGNYHLGYGIFDIVLWVISLEIQFYFLLPYLLALLKRYGVKVLWILLAALSVVRLAIRLDGSYLHELVYWTMLGRLDQFLVGMLAAFYCFNGDWLTKLPMLPVRKLAIGLIVSFTALVILLWVYTVTGWKYGPSYFLVVWPVLEPLVWAAVAACYVGLARIYQPRWLEPLRLAGVISFSLYILQYPIIKLLQRAGWVVTINNHRVSAGLISATLIFLPVTIVFAVAAYYLIEKPPLKLRKRYIN
ncbi:MAG TPA: acyltransferase [Candidatus Chromulinivoraceae bacterium]|nr:acyltransferase [Candidatus Chromulinivoraceae bacterium]